MDAGELVVAFTSLWGDPIEATLAGIVEDDDALVAEVVVGGAVFVHIAASESFGLMDEVLDAGAPEQLDPREPVRLTLRLKRGTYIFVAGHSDDEMPVLVARALTDARHRFARLLRQSEAWLLCTATQRVEVPGDPDAVAEIGLRTGWAHDD